jgi:PII-like signaling protein
MDGKRVSPVGVGGEIGSITPLRLSEDLPIIIEAIDSKARIEAVMPQIAPSSTEGLIVTLPVKAYVRTD